jgi:hypothetical protein
MPADVVDRQLVEDFEQYVRWLERDVADQQAGGE